MSPLNIWNRLSRVFWVIKYVSINVFGMKNNSLPYFQGLEQQETYLHYLMNN